jgi:RNA polymerase sigma-70 factor (ECF subfamily)
VTATSEVEPSPLAARPPVGQDGRPVALPVPATDDFAELFRGQYPRLIRALELSGAERGQAEDIAQEAFARTFAHWRRVRTGSNPPGYLFRVAFRLLRRRGLLPSTPLDERVEPAPVRTDDTAAVRVDVERALAVMPPRRRACVVLCWLLEADTAEAAEALSIAPGTVRKQLELARRQLVVQLTR